MAKLRYTFRTDTLFKLLFVKHPALLKRLVAELLGTCLESIGQFEIRNPEIPPDTVGDKFCRLDINMTVDGVLVNLEVQVADEKDYPERSLFYWAREYGSALAAGRKYSELPRTVCIGIVGFKMFECDEFYSEFIPLEVTRHTALTDRMSLRYYELPKLPAPAGPEDTLGLWLALFGADTEEQLKKIEEMEVPVMNEAIEAYRSITATNEFRELERMRFFARHNEASALGHARDEERAITDAKWQGIVREKDVALSEKDAVISEKDAALSENAALIAELRARLRDDSQR
jgi:predicted transposase/invertase (TIGR01784 family)